MSKVIKLRKGLDIHLLGEPAPRIVEAGVADLYAVSPPDFEGVLPKLLVREGDRVKAGSPLFFDKANEQILFCSPVSGVVAEVKRGEKRKLLAVVVAPDGRGESEAFRVPEKASREQVAATLLSAGMWPMLIRRPYGRIASTGEWPRDIFVSGFDSAPCAPDMNFVLEGELENLNAGVRALAALTDGKVHLGLRAGTEGVLNHVQGVEKHLFAGPHPAGNVGVQIHHVAPIAKGDVVWTVDVQNLAIIGRLFRTGRVDMTKIVAITGPQAANPCYMRLTAGAQIKSFVMNSNIREPRKGTGVRVVSGNALAGTAVGREEFLTFYSNQITLIEEGDHYDFFGSFTPNTDKFSVSRTYLSWLCPRKRYSLDTNTNGGARPILMTGIWEKYVPMDIHPMYLVKACVAGNIDRMEELGIYEVVPEDLALCDFVDPSKTEVQDVIAQGINLMIKELS